MPQVKKRKVPRCPFYQKMQRSVTDSFLCTGSGFWEPCERYEECLAWEERHGVPEPYIPAEPKRPFVSEAA